VEAESICLDILEVDPDNQQAMITLVLALTDQFEHDLSQPFSKAVEILQRLQEDYNRSYCHGIICERRAKAHLDRGGPGSGHIAYDWLHQAMQSYEKAIDQRLAGNDDAVLRWNTCARMIMRNPQLVPISVICLHKDADGVAAIRVRQSARRRACSAFEIMDVHTGPAPDVAFSNRARRGRIQCLKGVLLLDVETVDVIQVTIIGLRDDRQRPENIRLVG